MRSNVIIDKKYTQPILDWLLYGDNLNIYSTETPYHTDEKSKVNARPNIDLYPQDLVDANFPFKDFFHLRDVIRSEERRVGKECRSRGAAYH